jgi:glycine/D-amino acid oxidase-like deaminating enzyme
MSRQHQAGFLDTIVIGGGVVGMCIAYGLARAGERVLVLDQGDDAFRAARGNFGLVWVQGKGYQKPDYSRWAMQATRLWPAFARELAELTGVDVELSQIGGLHMLLTEADLAERVRRLQSIRDDLGGTPQDYPFEVLDHAGVRMLEPHVGPEVVGATFGPLDGHVSPLRLLRALFAGYTARGGSLLSRVEVEKIDARAGEFRVTAGEQEHVAGRLVLAAGLGNRKLAPLVGLQAPVAPNRGQIIVSERMLPFLRHPTLHVRQTGEGVVQIGDSMEDVGLDDSTSTVEISRIAAQAARLFPVLGNANIVRSWGALRVMTPDGLPIYQQSSQYPGAFVATCHSGVTLAAMHAGGLVDWMRGGTEPVAILGFKGERFDV